MTDLETVKFLINDNYFMTIATTNAAGDPWITPVGYCYDSDYIFYWVSSYDARHSVNIAEQSQVAISIYGKLPEHGYDGVYVEAQASVVEAVPEVEKVIKLFADHRPQPPRFAVASADKVTGDALWRVYKAVPTTIWKRVNTECDGQSISSRVQVKL